MLSQSLSITGKELTDSLISDIRNIIYEYAKLVPVVAVYSNNDMLLHFSEYEREDIFDIWNDARADEKFIIPDIGGIFNISILYESEPDRFGGEISIGDKDRITILKPEALKFKEQSFWDKLKCHRINENEFIFYAEDLRNILDPDEVLRFIKDTKYSVEILLKFYFDTSKMRTNDYGYPYKIQHQIYKDKIENISFKFFELSRGNGFPYYKVDNRDPLVVRFHTKVLEIP